MKRIVALVLALLMLFATTAAFADSTAGTLTLNNLSVSALSNGRTRTVRLRGMTLTLALGSAEGVPSIQMCLDNGKGQQVEGVAQVVDALMLMSVGGVSGTYYIDLEAVSGEPGKGARLAKAIGDALTLAGSHLDAVLYGLSTTGGDGVRTLQFGLPDELYMPVAESVFPILESLEAEEDIGVNGLFDRMEELEGGAVVRLRYKPKTGDIELAVLQDGSGVLVAGTAQMSIGETVFVDITADEDRYDLMHLDPMRQLEMKGELAIIALKFGKFALGTGLSRLFG